MRCDKAEDTHSWIADPMMVMLCRKDNRSQGRHRRNGKGKKYRPIQPRPPQYGQGGWNQGSGGYEPSSNVNYATDPGPSGYGDVRYR